jgi:xanthine permease XanP
MTSTTANKDLLYGLNDKPGVPQSVVAATQHVLASFVGIITLTLVIGFALDLQSEIPYLISMALFVSGVSTFIKVKTIGPVGCGLVAVQGTSFAFLSSILAAGGIAKARGRSPDEIIALIIGVCFFGAFVEIFLSQFISRLRRILTPLVTGIVITTIGLSLIKVAMAAGSLAVWFTNNLSFEHLGGLPVFAIPEPFKYGSADSTAGLTAIVTVLLIPERTDPEAAE